MSPHITLKTTLKQQVKLSDSEIDTIVQQFSPITLKKKQTFQPIHNKVTSIGFLVNGTLQSQIVDMQGNLKTDFFAVPHQFITDLNGFILGAPSLMHIEAASESTLLSLSIEKMHQLQNDIPRLGEYVQRLCIVSLLDTLQKQRKCRCGTVEERLLAFGQEYPHLEQAVAAKSIASFLEMDQATLCRVRKNRWKYP